MIPPRVKRIAAGAGILLASYLVMLLVLFPASLAWRLAEPMLELPFALEADAVSGQVWNGEAHGIRIDGQGMGSIGWRWQPAALMRGQLGLAVEWTSGGDHLVAELRLGRGSAAAQAVRGELAASLIQATFDMPVLLAGRIRLDITRIRWTAEANIEDAAGVLTWTDAQAGLPRPLALGQYRAELENIDGSLGLRIESAPDSPLSATGSAAWQPPDVYRVDLRLRASNDGGQNLENALATLGTRQPDGSHRLLIERP